MLLTKCSFFCPADQPCNTSPQAHPCALPSALLSCCPLPASFLYHQPAIISLPTHDNTAQCSSHPFSITHPPYYPWQPRDLPPSHLLHPHHLLWQPKHTQCLLPITSWHPPSQPPTSPIAQPVAAPTAQPHRALSLGPSWTDRIRVSSSKSCVTLEQVDCDSEGDVPKLVTISSC